MRTAVFVVVLVMQALPAPTQSAWSLPPGTSPYTATATGVVTDGTGATISVSRTSSSQPSTFSGSASVSARIPANDLRRRRVTLRGELQTRGCDGCSASLWMRVDKTDGMLLLDNGLDRAVRTDAEWAPFAVTLPVPSTATTVVVGVIFQGIGSVTARAMHFEAGSALSSGAPIAAVAQAELDAAVGFVRKNAWKRDNIDWTLVEPELRILSAGAETSTDVYHAIRFLLASLNDRHSFLLPPSASNAFRTGGASNPPADVRLLPDRIGYVMVPAYGGAEPTASQAYATRLHENLSRIAPQATCGWIVDLRSNGGGNMWPMLAGLKPFLGDEPLGTFISTDGSSPPWKAGQGVSGAPPASLRTLQDAWVAVLTGTRTASSGEAVTISFKGRLRTRSFGQPTAGLSSANSMFTLPDGAMIALTTAIEADRSGRRYGETVEPDEIVPDPSVTLPPADFSTDGVIVAATRWLKQSCR